MKIWRERAHLRDLLRRAEEEIFVLVIQSPERANDVSGVSSDAKLVHPPDVDGDFHGKILTTEHAGNTELFLIVCPAARPLARLEHERGVPDKGGTLPQAAALVGGFYPG